MDEIASNTQEDHGSKPGRERNIRLLWLAAFIAVFAWGTHLRIDNFALRGLEYDEIWTYLNYVSSGDALNIFSDLATPNNHPLNSLLCMFSVDVFGSCYAALRLPALLCGLLIPPLAGLVAWRVFESRGAAIVAMSVCAFNGGLTHYSQTARGYSIQSLLVLLSVVALLLYGRLGRRGRIGMSALFFASSALSALTVPTGIVFAGAAGAMWLALNIDFKDIKSSISSNRWMFSAFALCAIFFALWYGVNLQKFRAGQSFGDSISSLGQLAVFVWGRLDELLPWLWAVPLLSLIRKETRIVGIFCIGAMALSLLSALAVKGGPARVYLPIVPVAAIGAAAAFSAVAACLKMEWPRMSIALGVAGVMALGAQAELKKWTPTDWKESIPPLVASVPKEVYLCYPAGDGYPIGYNCRPMVQEDESARRMLFGAAIATVESPGAISGVDNTGRARNVNIPKGIPPLESAGTEGLRIEIYKLRRIERGGTGGECAPVFLKLKCTPYDKALFESLDQNWIFLNVFLKSREESQYPRFTVFARDAYVPEIEKLRMLGAEMFALEPEGKSGGR